MISIDIIKKEASGTFSCDFFFVGMKCAIFVNRSTTTKIASKDLDKGRSVMKSIEIDAHGSLEMSNGWNKP